ncbi:MAG: flagellar hook assembly protein FlgD [Pseudomonadota bacterium]|nr:flagellar hook assembly protein FlgD [Pseudomonadota bacterium]
MTPVTDFERLQDLGLVRSTPDSKTNKDLGQDDFLELMTTQLQNQDPFEPMENGEFLGQIAQFGTVSGIQDLQASFSTLAESLYANQALMAANLVDRNVLVRGNEAAINAGQSITGTVDLAFSTSNLRVNIADESGELIRTLDLGTQAKGDASFNWDGTDSAGNPVPAGRYQVQAQVATESGDTGADIYLHRRVDSVSLARQGESLTLNLEGGDSMRLAEVKQIG